MKKYIIIAVCFIAITACDDVKNSVSNAETVRALKEALNIGVEHAVGTLGMENGFFGDAAVKILLPEEIQRVAQLGSYIPGVSTLIENTILAINRSAEDAVKEATPIFVNAITSMTISDGVEILFGNNDEATQYLRNNTSNELITAFSPKIDNSLSKPLILNTSTTDMWQSLASQYNNVAESAAGSLLGLEPVTLSIGEYVTGKALDGLFTKIAVEEGKIRTDVNARSTDLLKKVFGQLD